jgi:hypothetical protein
MGKTKLNNHKTIIKRWFNKGLTSKEIAKKLKQNYNIGVHSTTVDDFISNEVNLKSSPKKSGTRKKSINTQKAEKKLSKFEIKSVVKELKFQAVNHLNKKELPAKDLNELTKAILNIMEIQSYYPDVFKD